MEEGDGFLVVCWEMKRKNKGMKRRKNDMMKNLDFLLLLLHGCYCISESLKRREQVESDLHANFTCVRRKLGYTKV
ncbi:hypothetical protein ACJIZ3_005221 [Penstemon smallii]|uniref:Uncharacterized protein n=1 Tax=Penstemon smallii TaxID=265156 RepID=A0ABD3S4A6_9LAMI